jgi:plastocyanin
MALARLLLAGAIALAAVNPAWSFHLYRNTDGGCSAASGRLTDDPRPKKKGRLKAVKPAATVMLLHNTYNDTATGLPITFIQKGQAVMWTWNSSHCHSVTGDPFDSGFHYPKVAPTTPQAVPGFFEYPIPEQTAKLSFVHTFRTEGTFSYSCVHHNVVGMQGVVVVQ